MSAMGLLGAAIGGIGTGMQKRTAMRSEQELAELNHRLSMELAQTKRQWAKEDTAADRAYMQQQMDQFQSQLPAGMYVTPPGIKVTDTRMKRAAAGGGGTRASDKIRDRQIDYFKTIMEDARTRIESGELTGDAATTAEKEYMDARDAYEKLIGITRGDAKPPPSGESGGTDFTSLDATFAKRGIKKEAPEAEQAATSAETAAKDKTPPKSDSFKEKVARRQAAQSAKRKELEALQSQTMYKLAVQGQEKARKHVRMKLEQIKRGASAEVIRQVNEALAEIR